MTFTSRDFYNEFIAIKNDPEYNSLPEPQKKEIDDWGKSLYKQLAEKEGKIGDVPDVGFYEQQEYKKLEPEPARTPAFEHQEKLSAYKTLEKNFPITEEERKDLWSEVEKSKPEFDTVDYAVGAGKSALRTPSKVTSTLVGIGGLIPTAAGAGLEWLADKTLGDGSVKSFAKTIRTAGEDTIRLSNLIDSYARKAIPTNQVAPETLKDFWNSSFGDKVMVAAENVPEQLATMLLPAAAAKYGHGAAMLAGQKLALAKTLTKTPVLTSLLAKWGPTKSAKMFAWLGSTAQAGSFIGKDQVGETGQTHLPSLLISAPISGLLESLVPSGAVNLWGGFKPGSTQAMQHLVRKGGARGLYELFTHIAKESGKSSATEFATEVLQESLQMYSLEWAKGAKGEGLLDAWQQTRKILEKDGFAGLAEAIKTNPKINQIVQAGILGAISGGVFEGAQQSYGAGRYSLSPMKTRHEMLLGDQATKDRAQKKWDNVWTSKEKADADKKAAEQAVLALSDTESSPEEVQEARTVFRTMPIKAQAQNLGYLHPVFRGEVFDRLGDISGQIFPFWGTAEQAETIMHAQPETAQKLYGYLDEAQQDAVATEIARQEYTLGEVTRRISTKRSGGQNEVDVKQPEASPTAEELLAQLGTLSEEDVAAGEGEEFESYMQSLEDAPEPDTQAKSNFGGIASELHNDPGRKEELTHLFPIIEGEAQADTKSGIEDAAGVAQYGNQTQVRAGENLRADGVYAGIDLDILQPEVAVSDAQNRNRAGSAASDAQVKKIENYPDPDRLISNDVFANDGPMVVAVDDLAAITSGQKSVAESNPIIVAGNGRVLGIKSAYQKGNTSDYVQALINRGQEFGIDPRNFQKYKMPGLVRLIDKSSIQNGTYRDFVIESNKSRNMGLLSSEKAQTDGQAILEFLGKLETSADNLNTQANQPFFNEFFNKVVTSIEERAPYFTTDGKQLSQDGVARVKNAIFQAAYKDPELLMKMADEPDPAIRAILNGLQAAAPDVARLASQIDRQNVYPISLAEPIAEAAQKISELRKEGLPPQSYFEQGQFGKDTLSEEARIMLGFFATQKSQQKINRFLREFNQAVRNLGSPNQMQFEGMEAANPETLGIIESVIWKEFPEVAENLEEWKAGPPSLGIEFSTKKGRTDEAPVTIDRLNEEIDKIQENVARTGVILHPVETVEEASKLIGQKVHPKAEGFYLRSQNVIMLIAENLSDMGRAKEVISHEVVGHHILPLYLGGARAEWAKELNQLKSEDAFVKQVYEEEVSPYYSPGEESSELAARLAETYGITPGKVSERAKRWIERKLSDINTFLRGIGIEQPFSINDLSAVIQGAKDIMTGTDKNIHYLFDAEDEDKNTSKPDLSVATRQTSPVNYPETLAIVHSQTNMAKLNKHSDYQAAKTQGDAQAAMQVVRDVVNDRVLADLKSKLDRKNPIVFVPILDFEGQQNNMLPMAYAAFLASKFNGQVLTDVFQKKRNIPGGSDKLRVASPDNRTKTDTEFIGDIPAPDTQVVIVDDVFTSGNTFTAMIDKMNEGGNMPVAATALAMGRYQNWLKITPEKAQAVLSKAGMNPLEFEHTFGYPVEHLTGSEAQAYILNGARGKAGAKKRFPVSKSYIDDARMVAEPDRQKRTIGQKFTEVLYSLKEDDAKASDKNKIVVLMNQMRYEPETSESEQSSFVNVLSRLDSPEYSIKHDGFKTMAVVSAGDETLWRGNSDIENDPGAVYYDEDNSAINLPGYVQYLQEKYETRDVDYILSELASQPEIHKYERMRGRRYYDPYFPAFQGRVGGGRVGPLTLFENARFRREQEDQSRRLKRVEPDHSSEDAIARYSVKLRDIEFVEDESSPVLIDVRGSNAEISAKAAEVFASWPEKVKAADGVEVFLKNKEAGRLSSRLRHLIWNNTTNRLDRKKAEWLANVPETLSFAAIRLLDPKTQNRIYVRAYQNGDKHMVVVRPDGTIENQDIASARLITQFPYTDKNRREGMEIEWTDSTKIIEDRGNRIRRSSGNPNLTPEPDNDPELSSLRNSSTRPSTNNYNTISKNINSDDKIDYAIAHHGTPHTLAPEPGFPHGRFRMDKVGSGEGNQAYGWGIYFAENQEVAEGYKERLRDTIKPGIISVDGVEYNWKEALDEFVDPVEAKVLKKLGDKRSFDLDNFLVDDVMPEIRDRLNLAPEEYWKVDFPEDTSSHYRLDIPDELIPRLLVWEKNISEQSQYIKDIFKNKITDLNIPGEMLYRYYVQQLGSRKAASEFLDSLGIPGIKYLDGFSRHKGDGTSNYVIWDQDTLDQIALLERNAIPLEDIQYSLKKPNDKEIKVKDSGLGSMTHPEDVKSKSGRNPTVNIEVLRNIVKPADKNIQFSLDNRGQKDYNKGEVAYEQEEVQYIVSDLQAYRGTHYNQDEAGESGRSAGQSPLYSKKKTDRKKDSEQLVFDFFEAVPAGKLSRVLNPEKIGLPPDFKERVVKGNFETETSFRVVGQVRTGFKKIKSPKEVAHLFAPLRKMATENLAIAILDKNKNLLGVMSLSKGAKDQTSGSPDIVVGPITRIPKAASFYIAHNHPTGNSKLSNPDKKLFYQFEEQILETGLKLEGLLAIGEKEASVIDKKGEYTFDIPPASRIYTAPELQKRIKKRAKNPYTLNNIEPLLGYAKKLPEFKKKNQAVIIFANNSLKPIGTLPIKTKELEKLRTGKLSSGYGKIMAAADKSNATRMFLIVDKLPDLSKNFHDKSISNLKTAMNKSNINLIDVIDKMGNSIWNEWGFLPEGDIWYSLKQDEQSNSPFEPDPEIEQPPDETGIVAVAKEIGIAIVEGYKDADSLTDAMFGDLSSVADRKLPEFIAAQKRMPEAETLWELEREGRNKMLDRLKRAEDRLITDHMTADKNALIAAIKKHANSWPNLRDWMIKKVARIYSAIQSAKPVEQTLFTIAEHMYWDGEKMKPIPGFREVNNQTGRFEYVIDPAHAKLAQEYFNNLSPEWKELLTERAKKNEEFRQSFVNIAVPWKTAQVATALAARHKQIGNEQASHRYRQQALGELARLPKNWNSRQINKLKSDLELLNNISEMQIGTMENIVRENSDGRLKSVYDLNKDLAKIESNQGIYGYVHHHFEGEFAPSKGKAFDALGKIPHAWYEDVPGSYKMRSGAPAQLKNLLQADIAQIKKEIRSEAANTWMQKVEDQYGLLVEEADKTPDMIPDGYDGRRKVLANFGKYQGEQIYLPDSVFEHYQMTKSRKSLSDPSLKEFHHALGVIEGITNRVNYAMLYHTGKIARDFISQPFHLAEFLMDWSAKHPLEIPFILKALAISIPESMTPKVWQKDAPETFGDYEEALPLRDDQGPNVFVRSMNKLIKGFPIGSVAAKFLTELNLAGAGNLPIMRVMRLMGEKLADKRGLEGKERDRFVWDVTNEYGYYTYDLPRAEAYLRGQRPTQGSKTLGMLSRTSVPFMGYGTRLFKQMMADPVLKGLLPASKRLVGKGSSEPGSLLFEIAETTRPLRWLFLLNLLKSGILPGGLFPPEEEGMATDIQDRRGLDPMARTAGRLLVKQDEDPEGGEYWLTSKGMGPLQAAHALDGVISGQTKFTDFSTEFLSLHPNVQLLLGTLGIDSPYSRNVPINARIGRFIATVVAPEMIRLGPDIAKLTRMVIEANTIPDNRKQNFLTAFFEQLGAPIGPVRVDRQTGELILTTPEVEQLKFVGLNMRYIPYRLIASEAESETRSLSSLTGRYKTIQRYRAGELNADMPELEFIRSRLYDQESETLDEAEQKLLEQIEKRGGGAYQTILKLKSKGVPVMEPDPEEEQKPEKPKKKKSVFSGSGFGSGFGKGFGKSSWRPEDKKQSKTKNKAEDLILQLKGDEHKEVKDIVRWLQEL